jgi:hypothetical protein
MGSHPDAACAFVGTALRRAAAFSVGAVTLRAFASSPALAFY